MKDLHRDFQHTIFSEWDRIRVKDIKRILKKHIPNYADKDHPTIQKYEAKGSRLAPSGAVSLEEHDLLHVLLGLQLLEAQHPCARLSENFLTGFQFGGDPNFTPNQSKRFLRAARFKFPDSYRVTTKGQKYYEEGLRLGREWLMASDHKSLGLFLEQAVQENRPLKDVMQEFYMVSKDYYTRLQTTLSRLFAKSEIYNRAGLRYVDTEPL
jgi:hypothetical protein